MTAMLIVQFCSNVQNTSLIYYCRLTVTSVAVCDTPAGKYAFYGYIQKPGGVPYGEKKGEVNLFDPGVLVADNGRVYMYTGFAPTPGWMKIAMGMRGLKIDAGYCVVNGSPRSRQKCFVPFVGIPSDKELHKFQKIFGQLMNF